MNCSIRRLLSAGMQQRTLLRNAFILQSKSRTIRANATVPPELLQRKLELSQIKLKYDQQQQQLDQAAKGLLSLSEVERNALQHQQALQREQINELEKSISLLTVDLDEGKNEVEIKDGSLIFTYVFNKLEQERGLHNMCFPKEILFLAGAPGAGKGTMTTCIMREKSFTADTIVVSDLLNTPEMREIKDTGDMVSDRLVVELVLRRLLDRKNQSGVIVDGFPRTRVQAEVISLLYDKMMELRKHFSNTPYSQDFNRPIFHLTVLFCEEKESIERQLKRGQRVREHNNKVLESGQGELWEERVTDVLEEAARKRYRYFKEHTYESLRSLREKFHYHFVDASGDIDTVEKNIIKELQYQSSIELNSDTFESISTIPLAEELGTHARQNLVKRLDNYQTRHSQLFNKVIDCIKHEWLHIIRQQALTGAAIIRSENEIFKNPMAVTMLLDIMCERGYQVILDYEKKEIPVSIDPKTFEFKYETKRIYHFEVRFEKPTIRRSIS